MRLRPDDLPGMVEGEARNVTFKLGGAVGANSISDFSLESCNSLTTFGTPSINGTNATVLVTAVRTGCDTIKATAELSSGETVIGLVRVTVTDCHANTTDY